MTYNALDKETVLFESGPAMGYKLPFWQTKPDGIAESTTGDASIGYNDEGVTIFAGANSGDAAGIEAGEFRRAGRNQMGVEIIRFGFLTGGAYPFDDQVHIGAFDGTTPTGTEEAYLDLGNGQYVANGTTAPIPSLGIFNGYYAEIEIHYELDEVIFRIYSEGSLLDETTINNDPGTRATSTIISAVSNGNDQSLVVPHYSRFGIPVKK